jgi:micrococcal nuclease
MRHNIRNASALLAISIVAAAVVQTVVPRVLIRTDDSRIGGSSDNPLIMSKVIDGDTGLLSDGRIVRYLGMDAPELGEEFFFEATRLNADICQDRSVRLTQEMDSVDQYGRILAYVFVRDTVMVNEAIVRAGMAHVYYPERAAMHSDYSDRLMQAQRAARLDSLGIWSVASGHAEDFYIRLMASPVFHRPECRFVAESDSERTIRYDSRAEPLDSGFSPCRFCKP